ncbi:MAG: STAS domain-containing protein [Bacteroidota bacterium]
MSSFSVTFRSPDAAPERGSVCVLDLKGELDAHTSGELEAAFQKCIDDERPRIVVHGGDLQYISSAGLGVFMAYIEEVREQGGDIKIAALQPRVYNVFDLLGFPVLFDITDSEAEAVERFDAA